MNIVILDGHCANPGDLSWEPLREFGELTVYPRTSAKDVVSRIADADAVMTNKTVLNAAVLSQLPRLKYIGVLATGFNTVDIEAARKLGITVTNVPAYSTESVAQMVFGRIVDPAGPKDRLSGDDIVSVGQPKSKNQKEIQIQYYLKFLLLVQ